MIITRKIELYINEDDRDKRIQIWQRLRELNDDVFKAANMVVSEQYFNDTLENRIINKDENVIYLDDEIRKVYRKLKKSENKDEVNAEIERLKLQKKEATENARAI